MKPTSSYFFGTYVNKIKTKLIIIIFGGLLIFVKIFFKFLLTLRINEKVKLRINDKKKY